MKLPKLPEFVYVLAFWKVFTFAVAGLLGLLVYFNVLPPVWAVPAGSLLAWVLAALSVVDIYPQIMERRARLMGSVKKTSKKSK